MNENASKARYDTAIIGGGLAGLVAAIEVARAGKKAVLLDKSIRVGGRAITVNKNGALFNLGAHALYTGGEANRILQSYGVKLAGKKPSVKGYAIWNNEAVRLPGDPMGLLSTPLLGWSGKIELTGLIVKLSKPHEDLSATLSLREWAEKEIRDPMVRHVFYSLCRTATYARDPDFQSARAVLRQLRHALKTGVTYLDGGWQSIVDGLKDMAVRLGVDVMTGANAAAIEHEGGSAKRIRLSDGNAVEAGSIISTLSPDETYRITAGAEHSVLRRWKEQARPVKAACLDLGLKKLPVPDRQFAMGIDQPVFFTESSRAAKLSDNGTIVVQLLKYNGPNDSDPIADEKLLEETMSLLQPGWEREVVARQYLPNITVVHDHPHVGRTVAAIGPSVPEIRGLYVAGDWASHNEMLADAAAASGQRAAQQALRDLAVELREAVAIR